MLRLIVLLCWGSWVLPRLTLAIPLLLATRPAATCRAGLSSAGHLAVWQLSCEEGNFPGLHLRQQGALPAEGLHEAINTRTLALLLPGTG